MTPVEELRIAAEKAIAALRAAATEQVSVAYSDTVSLAVMPVGHDSRVHVCDKYFGNTCVNYTDEGLVLDVFDATGEYVYENCFQADDLIEAEED